MIVLIGIVVLLVVLAGAAVMAQRGGPADGSRRFATTMIMAAGVMLALTTGLCSVAGTAFILLTAFGERAVSGASLEILYLLFMPAIGFVMTALGVWMYRRGRARAAARPD